MKHTQLPVGSAQLQSPVLFLPIFWSQFPENRWCLSLASLWTPAVTLHSLTKNVIKHWKIEKDDLYRNSPIDSNSAGFSTNLLLKNKCTSISFTRGPTPSLLKVVGKEMKYGFHLLWRQSISGLSDLWEKIHLLM